MNEVNVEVKELVQELMDYIDGILERLDNETE
jgi:hypothetical protein